MEVSATLERSGCAEEVALEMLPEVFRPSVKAVILRSEYVTTSASHVGDSFLRETVDFAKKAVDQALIVVSGSIF